MCNLKMKKLFHFIRLVIFIIQQYKKKTRSLNKRKKGNNKELQQPGWVGVVLDCRCCTRSLKICCILTQCESISFILYIYNVMLCNVMVRLLFLRQLEVFQKRFDLISGLEVYQSKSIYILIQRRVYSLFPQTLPHLLSPLPLILKPCCSPHLSSLGLSLRRLASLTNPHTDRSRGAECVLLTINIT